MPPLVIAILETALPYVLELLVSKKVMTQLEADGIKDVEGFIMFLRSLRLYSNPEDFPEPPPGKTNESNIERNG